MTTAKRQKIPLQETYAHYPPTNHCAKMRCQFERRAHEEQIIGNSSLRPIRSIICLTCAVRFEQRVNVRGANQLDCPCTIFKGEFESAQAIRWDTSAVI